MMSLCDRLDMFLAQYDQLIIAALVGFFTALVLAFAGRIFRRIVSGRYI